MTHREATGGSWGLGQRNTMDVNPGRGSLGTTWVTPGTTTQDCRKYLQLMGDQQ